LVLIYRAFNGAEFSLFRQKIPYRSHLLSFSYALIKIREKLGSLPLFMGEPFLRFSGKEERVCCLH